MKSCKLLRFSVPVALSIAAFACLVSTKALAAQSGKKNPTSKLFVSDLTGDSQIDTGEKIEPLVKKAVHSAEGTVIETKAGATDSLVLSNGTALYLGAETRLEVKRFQQEPFSPTRNDLDVEPSISQTLIKVQRGSVGICTSKLVAGSAMVYTTPHASINIRGRRLLLLVEETETRVYLLEGDITVQGDPAGSGETLKPGQFATIRRSALDQPAVVTIAAIPDEQNSGIDDRVAFACISRRTVYFETATRSPFNGDDAEIRPVEVVPAKAPTQFTVSPSRIDD
jgi:hypothetical protein